MAVAETGSPSRTSPWPDCFSAAAMQRLRSLRLGDTKTRSGPGPVIRILGSRRWERRLSNCRTTSCFTPASKLPPAISESEPVGRSSAASTDEWRHTRVRVSLGRTVAVRRAALKRPRGEHFEAKAQHRRSPTGDSCRLGRAGCVQRPLRHCGYPLTCACHPAAVRRSIAAS